MTPLKTALTYAKEPGWPVFPCDWRARRRKQPLTGNGFHAASTDPATIGAWWRRWPQALIGLPTGGISGVVVLNVDVKDPRRNGFDSLAERGLVPLPDTPLAHTQSGGLHIYFPAGEHEIRNSAGRLGPGLDVRGDGGYVIVPSPDSGYSWDPHANLRTQPLAPPLGYLMEVEDAVAIPPLNPPLGHPATAFVTPNGEAALYRAGRAIIAAARGEQETTLNRQCFAIGQLVGAGIVPAREARAAMHIAAAHMPFYDPRRPWRARDLKKVDRAFDAGLQRPRAKRHG